MSKTVASTLAFLNASSTQSFAGVNRLQESVALEEGSSKHLKKKLEQNGFTAKVYKDTEWQEYVVLFYGVDGKEIPESDYHTDDMDDAIGTAQNQLNQIAGQGNVDESASADEWDYYEFKIGESFVTALLYDDESGLDDEESADLKSFLDDDIFKNNIGHWSIEDDEGEDFCRDDITGLSGNCVTAKYMFKKQSVQEATESVTYSAFDKSGPAVQEMVQLSATTEEEAIAEAKVLGKERGWKVVGIKASKWSTDLDEQKGGRSFSVVANTKDGKSPKETVSGSFSFGAYDAAKKYAAKNLPGYEVIQGGSSYSGGRKFEAQNQAEGYGADIYVEETANMDEGIGDMLSGMKGGIGAIGSGIAKGVKKVTDTYANGRDTNIINKNQAKIDALKAKMDARNGTGGPQPSQAPSNQPAPAPQPNQQQAPAQQQVVQADAVKLLSSLSSKGKLEMKTAREIIKLAARLQAQGI